VPAAGASKLAHLAPAYDAAMDVTPEARRGPFESRGERLVPWAKSQLKIASDIVDNPGGGLVFATQTLGQVRAALTDEDQERWGRVAGLLYHAEDSAVRRRFDQARSLINDAMRELG
jgi:hypothetical protein